MSADQDQDESKPSRFVMDYAVDAEYVNEDGTPKSATARAVVERKFNPDQPRIPGGHEGGGRWGSFGAGLKLHTLEDLCVQG